MGKKDFGRVGVLMAGPSSEKKISLKSGHAILGALKASGINALPVIIKSSKINDNIRLLKFKKLDCAFIALHGSFGEDGGIQSILNRLKIPYTGSGVRASRLAMDKIGSRNIFRKHGLDVPCSKVMTRKSFKADGLSSFSLPIVIKPASNGSSIGLSIVRDKKSISSAIELAFKFDKRIIIEEYVKGRELTAGILDDKALPLVEIFPKHFFFDYSAKYKKGMTDYVVPAKLPGKIAAKIKKRALSAHKLLGCSGCSRVDIILDAKNKPVILEVNTIPGFTATSLLPKAADKSGIGFNELCVKLLELAYESRPFSREAKNKEGRAG
jgi:D-alanine-D-alanine ligase